MPHGSVVINAAAAEEIAVLCDNPLESVISVTMFGPSSHPN